MWSEFKKLFYTHFFPINTTIKAVNKLKEIIYYQGSYVVEDYLDKQILISETSYTVRIMNVRLYFIFISFQFLFYFIFCFSFI